MQTFVPEGVDLTLGFQRLDYRRLGKQRVETWQILNALAGHTKGWANHPASRMWRGHEDALAYYGLLCCDEWIRRGYKDTMRERFVELLRGRPEPVMPSWLNEVMVSHRSNLIRKLSEHYRPFWPDVPDDLEYIWPV